MPTDRLEMPDTPEQRRASLRAELLRRERTLRKASNTELADLADIDIATFSKAANGKRVSEETWIQIGAGLGWGGFLDYVLTGNLAAIGRCDFMPDRIRMYATERLLEIANS